MPRSWHGPRTVGADDASDTAGPGPTVSSCDDADLDIAAAGATNLAGFVRSTAGRIGTTADLDGGVAVAGPVAVLHGYVDAAIPTDLTVPPARFFDAAASFFGSIARPFVLWVPSSAGSHMSEAVDRGLVRFGDRCPAMVASHPVTSTGGPGVRLATDDESLATFGDRARSAAASTSDSAS